MPLSGPQLEQLHQALLSAFSNRADLEQMLLFKLDLHLNQIASGARLMRLNRRF